MFNRLILSRATKWGLLASMLAVFALFSGIFLPGCSNNPNSATDMSTFQDEVSFFDLPFDDEMLAKAIADPSIDVQVISGENLVTVEDGGIIYVGATGNLHEFIVPAGAVPYDVNITLEIVKLERRSNGYVSVIYDFGPDGLVFAEPAILRMDVTKVLGRKATEAHLYYLNEETGQWEEKGVFPAGPDNYVNMTIDHFSRWGAD